jgi:Protein of unknown function (DUF1593)
MKREFLLILLFPAVVAAVAAEPANAVTSEPMRPRVVVSTDIGGTDPDDFQSMVHLLLCADDLDLEGLISSPYGPGRREHILEVIERYERDYPALRARSPRYPEPAALRAMAKQGALESPGPAGVGAATEGSDWIVRCARRPDQRPLWVLVWGGIEDLAQALQDAPDILPRLRVYFIGGPNKMWTVDAYAYLERHHPSLWMIEANSTYRGWFLGGNQTGEWGNAAFVSAHAAGRGELGDYFASFLKGVIKMGDSPSVTHVLGADPVRPDVAGWGGRFARAWDGRRVNFPRLTSAADRAEIFSVVEFTVPLPAGMTRAHTAQVIFDNRIPAAVLNDGAALRFRFAPRDAKVWPYVIRSDFAPLDGTKGEFTAFPLTGGTPSERHPNWWTDDPAPEAAEGVHAGARTVSRWREDFLRDFARRLARCQPLPR